jgi:MFS family permease
VWLSYALFLEGLVFLLLSYEEGLEPDTREEDVALIETIFFVGIGIGAASNGFLTNKYGRKLVLIFCQLGIIMAEIAMVVGDVGPGLYGACTVVVGIGFGCGEIAAFVTMSEFVDN